MSFLDKQFFSLGIHGFRSDQFSLLIYLCLLRRLLSTVKMGNEENTENARYATNADTPL